MKLHGADGMGFKQNNCQTLIRVLVLCCRISSITAGNQRETVKDIVLADYQVPKGVSLNKSKRIQKQKKNVYIKVPKTARIYFQCKMLVVPNVLKVSERLLSVHNLINVL